MLSVYHIEKLFLNRQFETLLRGVCPIDMELSLPLRVRISQHPAAVTALALRRVLELTYGQTGLSREMIDGLLGMQSIDGSFENDPLATAAAAETLQRLILEQGDHDGQIADAMDRAWQALANLQTEDGLFQFADDRSEQDRALVAAFIAMLVGQSEACRGRVRIHAIADWFEEHDRALDSGTLEVWRLAMVEQTATEKHVQRRTNQMAAIAA